MKAALLRSLRANRPHAPARAARRMLAILRAALADPGSHLAITPAGVSLCWADDAGQVHRLSGHGLRHLEIALPLLALGCPGIDTRPCANRHGFIGAVLAAPWPRDHRALDRAVLAALRAPWREVAQLTRVLDRISLERSSPYRHLSGPSNMSLANDRKPRVPRRAGHWVEPSAPVGPLTRVFLRLAEAIGAVGTIGAAVALAVLLLA